MVKFQNERLNVQGERLNNQVKGAQFRLFYVSELVTLSLMLCQLRYGGIVILFHKRMLKCGGFAAANVLQYVTGCFTVLQYVTVRYWVLHSTFL